MSGKRKGGEGVEWGKGTRGDEGSGKGRGKGEEEGREKAEGGGKAGAWGRGGVGERRSVLVVVVVVAVTGLEITVAIASTVRTSVVSVHLLSMSAAGLPQPGSAPVIPGGRPPLVKPPSRRVRLLITVRSAGSCADQAVDHLSPVLSPEWPRIGVSFGSDFLDVLYALILAKVVPNRATNPAVGVLARPVIAASGSPCDPARRINRRVVGRPSQL